MKPLLMFSDVPTQCTELETLDFQISHLMKAYVKASVLLQEDISKRDYSSVAFRCNFQLRRFYEIVSLLTEREIIQDQYLKEMIGETIE